MDPRLNILPAIFFLGPVFTLIAILLVIVWISARTQHCGRWLNLSIAVLSVMAPFVCLEIGMRLHGLLTKGTPFSASILGKITDDELGWAGKETLGDLSTTKRRILFIGDSFTHGMTLDSSEMYYSEIGRILNAEIFAFGGLGYGTLQEVMAVKRYHDKVKPDLVVLQVCSNDFINNSWELERESYLQNAMMVRPYYKNGSIEYRIPSRSSELGLFLNVHSRVFHYIYGKIEKALHNAAINGYLESVESKILRDKIEFPQYMSAVQTTASLISQFKAALPRTPIVSFQVDEQGINSEMFTRIFENEHIPFLTTIPKVISKANTLGRRTTLADRVHWNSRGNKIAGELLSNWLLELDYLY